MADSDSTPTLRDNAAPLVNVLLHPTAMGDPVKQTRVRGRLPKSVTSLQQVRRTVRIAEIDLQMQRGTQRGRELQRCVSQAMAEEVLTPHEARIVGSAMDILNSRLRRGTVCLHSPGAVLSYLQLQIGALPHEEFGILFLDSQNRLIEFERLFRGSLNQTAVYPREVLLRALAHRASSVILAHNHPSGAAKPSKADVLLTEQLRDALALVEVRILDHFIVTTEGCTSMAEMGLL